MTICLLCYAAASLLHHIHNAEFLADYPNMPASLTPGTVYLAWTIETAVGVLGYVLFRAGYRLPGLALIALYAAAGFSGLDHYVVARFSAHTAAMHFTILMEVASAGLLLVAVFRERRGPAVTA
jgi:hypothetical protein